MSLNQSLFKNIFDGNAFLSLANTVNEYFVHNGICMFPHELYTCGIRTLVISSWGRGDVHCAIRAANSFFLKIYTRLLPRKKQHKNLGCPE
jgi:hypothetical protein